MHNAKEDVRAIFKRVEHRLCLPQIDHPIATGWTRAMLDPKSSMSTRKNKTSPCTTRISLALPSLHSKSPNYPDWLLQKYQLAIVITELRPNLTCFFFLLSYSLWSFSTTSIFRTFHRGGPLRLSRNCFPSLSNFSTMRAFRVPHILVPVFLFQTRPAW